MTTRFIAVASILLVAINPPVHADSAAPDPDSHAPIGVMGDHVHQQGEWMFSYRFMSMDMEGNLKGSSHIDVDTIVTSEANAFSGIPGQPPTLRIVPLAMTMDMHMLGLMFAPSDKITLMLMANYWNKSMNHVTVMGGMGTTELGTFRTQTSGWSDTTLTGLFSLPPLGSATVHAILGVSLPTGSTDETGQILTPMNMTPTVRLPYPMQLGSGSFDPIVGVNIAGGANGLGWGAQWRSTFRLSDNDEDYSLGDEHRLTGWLSWQFADPVSGSMRVEYYERGNISGRDSQIMGPVQTADPNRQEAKRMDFAIGLNLAAQTGSLRGWRLAVEYIVPVDQNLDGPQLETDWQLVVGVQKSFGGAPATPTVN